MQEELRRVLKAQPFVPFTIVMSNGNTFEVRHPEHAALGKHWLYLVDADNEESVHDLYLLHVAEVHRSESSSPH